MQTGALSTNPQTKDSHDVWASQAAWHLAGVVISDGWERGAAPVGPVGAEPQTDRATRGEAVARLRRNMVAGRRKACACILNKRWVFVAVGKVNYV